MLDLVLRLIKAVLASLYMLFEGLPALEALRSWLGSSDAAREARTRFLGIMTAAAVLSLLAFLLFLWLLSRRPVLIRGRRPGVVPELGIPPEGKVSHGEGDDA